ncbi:MAG: hypothetical protein F6J94_27790 [Moorea sp. SIO1F2]|uniref:hypothetical protein n=1 Tax=Moorena sp. SIO1F2 TaxID=2607819 RepID=UPI0013B74477|nr:hypothetical protein [Moorena sp. SIO1F2]NET85560.1 hypothetical protein [Moorena sp. SIO1F2]
MFRLGSRTQFTIGYRDPCRDCENFFPLLPTPYSLLPVPFAVLFNKTAGQSWTYLLF